MELETELFKLFPLVILISSVWLKPDAQERVKKAFPALVSILVALFDFWLTGWPASAEAAFTSVSILIGLVLVLYQPISAVVELVGNRSLNEVTGRGLVGPSGLDAQRD